MDLQNCPNAPGDTSRRKCSHHPRNCSRHVANRVHVGRTSVSPIRLEPSVSTTTATAPTQHNTTQRNFHRHRHHHPQPQLQHQPQSLHSSLSQATQSSVETSPSSSQVWKAHTMLRQIAAFRLLGRCHAFLYWLLRPPIPGVALPLLSDLDMAAY